MRRAFNIAGAGVALTLFFVVLIFPFERYRPGLEHQLTSALGVPAQIGEFGMALGLGGPVLRLQSIQLTLRDSRQLIVDELRVRPALSLSWLRLEPALRVWVESDHGNASGTLWWGSAIAYSGVLENLDLDALPIHTLADRFDLRGEGDVELDLALSDDTLDGSARIQLRAGSVAFPPLGLPVPFETVEAELSFDPETGITIERFALEDPGLSLQISGTIRLGPIFTRSLLDLEAHVEVRNPGLVAVARDALGLGPGGAADLRILGTIQQPQLRPASGER